MSEDDRALKAARAKAMLKKRQQKKIGAAPNTPTSPLTSLSVSRAISPARSESPAPTEDEKKDLGDVFSPGDSDTSWVNSLPRVRSPERPVSVSPPPYSTKSPPPGTAPTTSQRPSPPVDDKQILLQNQQQTISLLVSEKASLSAELEHLEGLESKMQEKESLLEQERNKSNELEICVRRLQTDSQAATEQIQNLRSTEKQLMEKCRDQERELQLLDANLTEMRAEAEQHQRKVRELEERIQSDDRAERLESSLRNTQDRADGLEFQLSKLKQAHTTLKTDREAVETQLRTFCDDVNEWKAKHAALHQQHSATDQQLASMTTERDALSQEKSVLHSHIDSTRKALAQLQDQLNHALSELSANQRQLQKLQAELKHANRRADQAESTQKDLQAEGTTLMRSLDEMRPKIVELTGVKLELGEKLSSVEHALRSRDAVIAQLESTVDELQNQKDDADKQRRETLTLLEVERSSTHTDSMELQAAYTELQAELDASRASKHIFEVENLKYIQEAARRSEEIDRLTASSQAQLEEMSSLRRELEERESAQEEEQDFLERAQSEIETLRLDLSSKDEEIERLRESVILPLGAPRSLDDEMLSSLQQQHALDLSAAQSKNRELETAVFEAQARAHSFQKQVNALEEQLAQTRSTSRAGRRSFSPGIPSRPSSRNVNQTDLRRSSFSSRRPSNLALPPLARSVFDVGLSPDTRHKRQVSLRMLKARIESEMAATSSVGSRPPSRALSPVASLTTIPEPSQAMTRMASHRRPQFLDESHVFWCHSCEGELVVL